MLLVVLGCGIFYMCGVGTLAAKDYLKVNVDTRNTSYYNLISTVYKQTGFKVAGNTCGKNYSKGLYVNIKVNDFFERIYKGRNVAITINEKARIIHVQCFGHSKIISPNGSHIALRQDNFSGPDREILLDLAEQQSSGQAKLENPVTESSRKEVKNVNIDPLTGLSWLEAEKKMGLGITHRRKLKNIILGSEERAEREAKIAEEIAFELKQDKIIQQKEKFQEQDMQLVDPMTGLTWREAEKDMGLQ